MPISVAIIGAGPAGFYTAEALLSLPIGARVDVIERLPSPYGLVRAGVAPDHQGTKRVAHRFAETASHDSVAFFGNVAVGRDVSLDELRALYDAVVLAVGAPSDRALGIPGDAMPGVYGSASFVGWYNGHPDFCDLAPKLDTRAAVVIGNGNVALDVARVLVKSPAEMAETDIAEHAARAIHASPLTDVYILGRRGPGETRFTSAELRELGRLADCAPVVDPADLPEEDGAGGDAAVAGSGEIDREKRIRDKNLAILRSFTTLSKDTKRKRMHFCFHAAPAEIVGGERVEGLRYERTRVEQGHVIRTGVFGAIACGLVVAAIGYRASRIAGLPFDGERGLIPNEDGRVAPGVYAVGWAKRGPTGIIASNRPDGIACARQIAEDVMTTSDKPGRAGLERLLGERGARWISFAEWQRLDAAEVTAGGGIAPRRKFISLAEMLTNLND
ncbi:MAG: hypothetical protein EA406_03415 [Rhodospirillales bacterium]|nr:MAG: hypothetical protein EA406_03415 [Rhodospirillales bacterium]